MPKVQLRGGFSERNGLKENNKCLQKDSLDTRSRNAIINFMVDFLNPNYVYYTEQFLSNFYCDLIRDVFCEERPRYKMYKSQTYEEFDHYIKSVIRKNDYDEVLTLVEYVVNYVKQDINIDEDIVELNKVFEREYVAYRYVGFNIIQITDEMELKEIDEVIQNNPYENCKKLMQEAVSLFSVRDNPNYSLVIQRSITAVESVCQIIVGEQQTLGKTLKKLEKNGLKINPSLKEAFNKLYGWTTDENDCRHANAFKDVIPTFEDAKFMLVVCSAFINYLIAEIAKIK